MKLYSILLSLISFVIILSLKSISYKIKKTEEEIQHKLKSKPLLEAFKAVNKKEQAKILESELSANSSANFTNKQTLNTTESDLLEQYIRIESTKEKAKFLLVNIGQMKEEVIVTKAKELFETGFNECAAEDKKIILDIIISKDDYFYLEDYFLRNLYNLDDYDKKLLKQSIQSIYPDPDSFQKLMAELNFLK